MELDACFLMSQSLHRRLDCGIDSDDSLLQETIDVDRQAFSLCGQGHHDRAECCDHLANSLKMRYERVGDVRLLAEAIDLEREALTLRPPGHPDCSLSTGNLGSFLMLYYQHTDDRSLLDESISLQREMHDMTPVEHPHRPLSCGNLALSLKVNYQCTGDYRLLDEAIDLERQALSILSAGHSNHASFCGNLAASLGMHYERTGDSRILDEAINLEREALDLRPQGHPRRALSCERLATFCHKRYERYESTGDVHLLEEVIHLEREALALHPRGHPGRSLSCGNLANFLMTQYGCSGPVNAHLLDEAIELDREALILRPPGHPHRATSCGNLAVSLDLKFRLTGNVLLLDEVIDLEREALGLRPKGHPDRAMSCGNLAISLRKRYLRRDDETLLREIVTLQQDAVVIAHAHAAWRHSSELAWVHLQATGPFYDVSKAIVYLLQTLENEHDNIPAVVRVLLERLEIIWDHSEDGQHVDLTAIYQRLVHLLPLLAHPTLDVQSQLQVMKASSRIGPDAFVNAAMKGLPMLGLEVLEMAQGLIWSQTLHRRDPQLENVPVQLASRLQRVLQATSTRSVAESHSGEPTARTWHDTLHVHSSEAYALIREIRALPGLDRFMLGKAFEALSAAASHHPVVILVGARGRYYALIIASSVIQGHALLTLDLTDDEVNKTFFTRGGTGSRRGAHVSKHPSTALERLSLAKHVPVRSHRLDRHLRVLWHKVVVPVLDCLGLKVREREKSKH
jgi:tetratricopeptide (TPR) repeat protein